MAELGLNPGLLTSAYFSVLSNPPSSHLPLCPSLSPPRGLLAISLLRGKGSDHDNFSSAEMFLEKKKKMDLSLGPDLCFFRV